MPADTNGESFVEDFPSLESSSDISTADMRKPEKMKATRQRERGKKATRQHERGKQYTVHKSRVLRIVDWTLLLHTYVPYLMLCAVSLLTVQLSYEIWMNQLAIGGAYDAILQSREVFKHSPGRVVLLGMGWKATAVLVVILWMFLRGRRPVYLIDFAVFEPPGSWKLTHDKIVEILRCQKVFTDESVEFMVRGWLLLYCVM